MASNQIAISRRSNWLQRSVAQLFHDLGAWLYVVAVVVLATVLAFVYLAQASYAARQIELMVDLEKKLDLLHEENSILRLQIAGHEDPSRIKAEARAMGLGEATRVEYIEVLLDEAGPLARGNTTQSLPGSGANSGQLSALQGRNGVTAWPDVRFVSSIAQQFQGWISKGTAGLGTR